ncbi:protein broad-minded-like [Lingula anatina]|uniref:Protein broad-minded n=1 Tax=Lingula anatina TaxID=7574 RepID=A0A1S3JQ29_LINAN|nr:protein broad-minded-like [Lingula anatina]|eukprot:XP_013412261.1 protein broad-minded-like [Lingula anatina]
MKDVYALLTEHLMTQFQSRNSPVPKIKHGLDCRKQENIALLKAFRLMNEFQNQICVFWIRYSDRFLESLVESTLSLLAISYSAPVGGAVQMTPVHFLALLDPKASWFTKWMHGGFSRTHVLSGLEKHRKIVDIAVRQCMEFASARKIPLDLLSDISDALSRESFSDAQRMHYVGPELEYIHFMHSMHLVGKLLQHSKGRDFFPVRLKDREEPVSVTELLVTMIHLISDPSCLTYHKPSAVAYDPGVLAADMLKKLCISEDICQICMCKDDIINTLLTPITHWLDDSMEHDINQATEVTYLHIADILAALASTSRGRQHLLYGERQERFTRSKSSAAHIIAEFVKKAINGILPNDSAPPPSNKVIGAFTYICRQLYNTCEGLLVMYSYDLHMTIAAAHRQACLASEMVVTPTPSINGSDYTCSKESRYSSHEAFVWEDTLRDNLLNFAATPKGLLLLQQTGAIDECVEYMYARYEKKLQLSKYEKFGYGTMMTQVAATAPGMMALQNTGFIKAMVNELWSVLECGSDDRTVFTPKTWPVEPIDRFAHKSLIRMLNILSAFPAVYEVLCDKTLPVRESYSLREMPNTILEVLDRLVLVDTDAKIHSLFNYEQSHVFGLRLLSSMFSCLDTFLLLQTQYRVQDVLLACQENNTVDVGGDIIVDMLSIERNYLLVKSYLIGGPTERVIPPKVLSIIFVIPGTDSALRGYHLTPLQQLGVKMAVRYGMHLKVLNSSPEATENLTQLLKQCGYFLHQQQKSVESNLHLLQGDYPGFDWFASTIFLLMNGNLERSWKFLYQFSTLVASGYLWIPRLHSSVHLPQGLMSSGIPPLFSTTGHNVELILLAEVPEVFSAFKMSGYTVSQIVQHWLRQCFWNFLDWLDITHYICLCTVMGIDYQVYLCVAILKHMKQEIMHHVQQQDLVIFLKEEPIQGFRVGEHLEFMQQLEKKFRKTIFLDMQSITKP